MEMVVIDANNNIYYRHLTICFTIHVQNMCNNNKYIIQKKFMLLIVKHTVKHCNVVHFC